MHRKYKAAAIFNGLTFLPEDSVLVTQMSGKIIDIVPESEAGEGIENINGIISPGFINAHCHIELSHLHQKFPKHTGLVEFVQQVIFGRAATDEFKSAAMQNAVATMGAEGIVAVGDICNTTDSISLKKKSKLYWHNFIEVSGFVDAGAQKRLDEAKIVLDTFKEELSIASNKVVGNPPLGGGGAASSTLSPHAPYSVGRKLFSLLNESTADQLISIHNQEAAAENKLYKEKRGDFLNLYKKLNIDIKDFNAPGMRSLPAWLSYFYNGQKILSVHNTFTNQGDIDFVKTFFPNFNKSEKFVFCICPNANLYIENKLPPVNLLRKNDVTIALGTDSLASNDQLSILAEMKTIATNFPQISLEEILQWATLNGAKALGITEFFGTLQKGFRPGLVGIEHLENGKLVENTTARKLI